METVLDEVCASCGNARMPDGRFCLFCGDVLSDSSGHKGGQSQHSGGNLREDSTSPAEMEYAGFWRRFWAGGIDMAIEASGALLLTLALDLLLGRFGRMLGVSRFDSKVFAGMAFIPIWGVGSWLYCALLESSSWRATIGKRLLGVEVVSGSGERISFGQASARHLMKFLSLFSLTVGFMMAGWTKRRQALHDLPCDCLVIRVPEKNLSLFSR